MAKREYDWRLESSGDIVRIENGDRYSPGDFSYYLNPQPGIYLIDRRSGPIRIPVAAIQGLTGKKIRSHIGSDPSASTATRGTRKPQRDDAAHLAGPCRSLPIAEHPAVSAWIQARQSSSQFELPDSIAVCGHGPLRKLEVRRLIEQHGSSATEPGDPDAAFLLVGHDGWLVDEIEGQIRARSGKDLYIFSHEMLLISIGIGAHPFKPVNRKVLSAFEQSHEALQCCREEGFEWMSLDTTQVAQMLGAFFDQVEETPLTRWDIASVSPPIPRAKRAGESCMMHMVPTFLESRARRTWVGGVDRIRVGAYAAWRTRLYGTFGAPAAASASMDTT